VRAISLAAALALAVTVTACGGDDQGKQGRSLKVGYAYGFDVGDTADRIAFDRLARDTDIQPSFEETGDGSKAIAALVRGDIDMAKVSFTDAINAIGQGADIRLILSANPHLDLVLAARPELHTLADLRGKRILLDRPGPSISAAELRIVLKQAGLEEGDYELGFLPDSQNRIPALASGRADAASLESVDLELARQDTQLNQLVDLGARVPEPSNVFVVRGDFAKENSALLDETVRELLAGFETLYGPGGRDAWIKRARADYLADQPEGVAARIYEKQRRLGYWLRGGPLTEAQHRRALDFLVANGVVEKPVPFDEAWDVSFWRKAAGGG
jgi:ABC-type nitrate/sulfonate/bicarbonate transport system substrate-binding protein